MILLTVLLSTYILAVNYYAFRLLKKQQEDSDVGDMQAGDGDGRLLLIPAMGGAIAVFVTMFVLR